MFRVGEFSNLSKISVKMLRHYDEIGLLIPSSIDDVTGYRYYSAAKLMEAQKIVSLKAMGFRLQEIKTILQEKRVGEDLLSNLQIKKEEHEKALKDLQIRIKSIDEYRRLLEMTKEETYEIKLISLPQMYIGYIQEHISFINEQVDLYVTLIEVLAKEKYNQIEGSPLFTIYYEGGCSDASIVLAVCKEVDKLYENTPFISFKKLDAVSKGVSVFHMGDYEGMDCAIRAAASWIEENDYHIAGEIMERYHRNVSNELDSSKWLTEVIIPVEK